MKIFTFDQVRLISNYYHFYFNRATRLVLFLLFYGCFTSTISYSQVESMMPILSDPQVMLDKNGLLSFEIPKGEHIINSLNGEPDQGWMKGMADNNVGTCDNIITYNYETRKHALYNSDGERRRVFSKTFKSLTPCSEGFYLGHAIEKSKSGYNNFTYYFYDANGSLIFDAQGYSNADVFVDGLAAVKTKERKWAYINDLGHELSIIPEEIERIVDVSSFYGGVSVVKSSIKDGIKRTFRIHLINKQGDIIFDSNKLANRSPIKRYKIARDGVVSLSVYKAGGLKSGYHVVHINKDGEVILETKETYSFKPSENGYILSQTKSGENAYKNQKIITTDGKQIKIPKYQDADHGWIHQIQDQYFLITYEKKEARINTVFDAKKGNIIYEANDNVMGVKGDIISLANSSTKRFYAVNINSKEITYDTKIEDQVVVDLSESYSQKEKIKTYRCTNIDDVEKLSELIHLEELTIQIPKLTELPDLSGLTHLKVLRLDECGSLIKFPTYIDKLTQLSLRNCTSATNLVEMIDAQKSLEKLFIINFDISKEDALRFSRKYPDAKISGSAKFADYQIQEHILGF
jgi:hypothetical protein